MKFAIPLTRSAWPAREYAAKYAPDDTEKNKDFQYITGIISEEIKRLNRIVRRIRHIFPKSPAWN